jgi:hypothetical protein
MHKNGPYSLMKFNYFNWLTTINAAMTPIRPAPEN